MRRSRRSSTAFTVVGWLLALVMALYILLIVVPKADAREPKVEAELLLEIKDEKLKIFQFETSRILCEVVVIEVRMIGSQAAMTCVLKDTHEDTDDRRRKDPSR